MELPLVTFNSIVKKWPWLLLANTSGVPRELRFSSLVREKSLQDLRIFWYSLASGPTYFLEVTLSFFLSFNDANIPMILATSPYGLVHKYCNNCFLCSSVNSNIYTPFYKINLGLLLAVLRTNLTPSLAAIMLFSCASILTTS